MDSRMNMQLTKAEFSTDNGATWTPIVADAHIDYASEPDFSVPVILPLLSQSFSMEFHVPRRKMQALCKVIGVPWGERRAKRRARKRAGK
jgi:hypothetical protein